MRQLFLLLFLILSHALVHAQGLNFDDSSYVRVPQKYLAQVTASAALPARVDLSPYAPSVVNQGTSGTCVGFASAYYGRTILEAVSRGITDQAEIDALRFSPSFLYNAIKDSTDTDCMKGSTVDSALTYMRDKGVATFADQGNLDCGKNNLSLAKSESRIMDFIRLFGLTDNQVNVETATKKALSEMTPVLIAIQTTPSLKMLGILGRLGKIWRWIVRLFGGDDKSGLWEPSKSKKRSTGHAVCVVGYDDDKFGGAFKVVNSWGKSWGDEGYFWITYPDFAEYTKYGYQAYLPIVQDTAGVTLAGSISIQSATFVTDNELSCVRSINGKTNSNSENEEGMTAYSLRDPQRSGNSLKFVVDVNRPSYVYVLGASNNEFRTTTMFPVSDTDSISPFIGANTKMLLPSGNIKYFLDDEPGTEFVLFLFSEKPLDIVRYVCEMNKAQGNFTNRALMAFGRYLVPYQQVEYDDRKINFTLRGKHEGHIVPLLVSLEHK